MRGVPGTKVTVPDAGRGGSVGVTMRAGGEYCRGVGSSVAVGAPAPGVTPTLVRRSCTVGAGSSVDVAVVVGNEAASSVAITTTVWRTVKTLASSVGTADTREATTALASPRT